MVDKNYNSLKNKLIKYLTYRGRSIAEVKVFLTKKIDEMNLALDKETTVPKLVDYMVRLGYLDDRKFAEALIATRINHSKHGPYKIRSELKTKGINQDLIDELLNDKSYELDTAKELALKHYNFLRNKSWDIVRRRILNYLIRRGFQTEVVFAAIDYIHNDVIREN